MASSPSNGREPGRQPAPGRGSGPALRPWLVAGVLLVGTTAAGLWWAERELRRAYDRARDGLEQQLSRQLGHPLQLGPLRGIGWGGLELGPSRLLAGPADASTAEVAGISVSFDPLASLRQRLPVLHVGLRDARITLRRNARGQFWVLGQPAAGPPPRLDLRLRLVGPARVRLEPAGLEARVTGRLALQPARRQLELQAQVAPGGGGSLGVRVAGSWNPGRWQIQLEGRRLALGPLQGLVALPGAWRGEASGKLALQLDRQQARCQGLWQVPRLEWQGGPRRSAPLERLAVACAGTDLALSIPRWQGAGWSGEGRLGFNVASGRLQLQLQARPPGPGRSLPLRLEGRGRWRQRQLDTLVLQASRGRSQLQITGTVGSRWNLASRLTLRPLDLGLRPTPPEWLLRDAVTGQLSLTGPLRQPTLSGLLGQAANPLLGRWRASLGWRGDTLRLERFSSAHLEAHGRLPLQLAGVPGLRAGALDLAVDLRRYPLRRLSPALGARLEGVLDGRGVVRGPLGALVPDLALGLERPGAGPVGLQEQWRGRWLGAAAGGGVLRMEPLAPALPGLLTARLDRRWVPVRVLLQRGGGELSLQGRPRAYRWQSRRLPLEGLTLALGPRSRVQPLQGNLSGSGDLNLQPLGFAGEVAIERPMFLGVRGRRLALQGRYSARRYSARGRFEPEGSGTLLVRGDGAWKGPFRGRFEGRGLGADLFRQLVAAWPQWRDGPAPIGGTAEDLAGLFIDTLGGTIENQLQSLAAARGRLALFRGQEPSGDGVRRLETLQARVDLDLDLRGASLAGARADLEVRSHLWLAGADADTALTEPPLVARLQGPLRSGAGRFSFEQLPLSLVALLTPVPSGLSGSLNATGRYRLGGTAPPALALDLGLDGAALRGTPLSLERGLVALEGRRLRLDLALRAAGASSSVELAGVVPLDPADQSLELRLASRGDGVRFLTAVAEPALQWQKGSADLQLLVRGSLQQPIANGFIRVRNGQLRFIDQAVRNVEGLVLFDFQQLFLQELTASVGANGKLSGSGSLALWTPPPEGRPAGLAVELRQVPFQVPRLRAVADGNLRISGSLRQLVMGGDLRIARGSVNVQPGRLASEQGGTLKPVTPPQLAEARWDFRKPLVLLGPEIERDTGESLRANVPQFSPLAFDDLRLRLGPDLRVGVPNVANFTTGGQLRLSGRLDPSLRATGVVRLLGGRLNLFTTTFNLDPDAPNVAVFTPALGLVPYLDIALRTRVSDSLNSAPIGVSGIGKSDAQSLASAQPQSGFSSLNQLNLVRITVSVSGPADRLADTLRLRSSPPLPQERLIALIGGNSLAGLTGRGAGAALATVLGQSLLSPVLGGLSEAFGQRLSFALYPTYVNPSLSDTSELRSRQVPPQLVLGSEIGVDVTERFNASVLAAPNRSDVPPQLNLSYKASENLNVQAGFDTQGAWQGQLQLFFRF
ncbi:MAG: translocation/assembly module TamB domain-containing protein [Cyanobacteriota bacterium]